MQNLLNLPYHLVNHLFKVKVRCFSSEAHSLSLPVKEVTIGLILGDASIVRKYANGNAYFKYAQSVKHAEYLNLVFSLLKPYCKMSSPTLGQAKFRNQTYGVLSFTSRSLPCFTELHTLFYLDRIKLVPSNIAELLTPVGLAFWSMDDGSKCSNGFHLNTNAFSIADLELLLNVLRVKFGLTCSLHSRSRGHRIYISASSMSAFRALVTPHFHSSMLYKLS
jgi:hypothetical protein